MHEASRREVVRVFVRRVAFSENLQFEHWVVGDAELQRRRCGYADSRLGRRFGSEGLLHLLCVRRKAARGDRNFLAGPRAGHLLGDVSPHNVR